MKTADENAYTFARDYGILLWDRKQLVELSGPLWQCEVVEHVN